MNGSWINVGCTGGTGGVCGTVSAAFLALVSVVFVVLVRKDAHDHAIWTGVVVPHPVVTDHHHRHSLELILFEAQVTEIVVVRKSL